MKRIERYFPHFPAIDDPAAEMRRRAAPGDTAASNVPYLVAAAFAAAAVAAITLLTALPPGPVVELGVIFVALAVVVRWLEDVPRDRGGPILRMCADLCASSRDAWGLVFYTLAGCTTFVWLETGSLLRLEVGETLTNALSAAVWWYPMWDAVGAEVGVTPYVLILAAAWAFWLVLGIRPEDEPWLSG